MTVAVRRTLLSFVSLVAMLMLAVPASAQAPYPAGDAITCDASVVSPGDTLTCTITGCQPGTIAEGTATFQTDDSVQARGQTVVTGTDVADASGAASIDFKVPDNANGTVDVTMTCVAPDGSIRVLSAGAVATVAAPGGGGNGGAGGGGGALGNTGGPFQMGSLIGASLLLAGALLLVMGGRRKTI